MPWRAIFRGGWNPTPPLALSEDTGRETHTHTHAFRNALCLPEASVRYIRTSEAGVLAGPGHRSEADVLRLMGPPAIPGQAPSSRKPYCLTAQALDPCPWKRPSSPKSRLQNCRPRNPTHYVLIDGRLQAVALVELQEDAVLHFAECSPASHEVP